MSATLLTDPGRAAAALGRGCLVALPTETVYGLGGNALDATAVANIFAAKDRPAFDPLILHQSSAERLFPYVAELPPAARRLAAACWPGPLTLVLPKRPELVSDLVSAGLPTVALRVPDHPLTLSVLERVPFPVAAPSANPFGFVSPTRPEHVLAQLGERIDYVLDGGPCRVGLESTIVGFPDGRPTVYRKGGLTVEAIAAVLGHPPAVRTHGSSRPAAPGMLARHYSPGLRMELFDELPAGFVFPPNAAWVRFGRGREPARVAADVYDLSPEGDLAAAAQQLFALLRLLGQRRYAYVAVERLPETGLGRAINDRLTRAAATE